MIFADVFADVSCGKMETKPLKITNIAADIVTNADTDADVMETQLYLLN